MGELISEMFGTGFSNAITGLATGVKDMFLNFLYVDPTAAEKVVSDVAKFGFAIGGVSMALGIGYIMLRKVRGM